MNMKNGSPRRRVGKKLENRWRPEPGTYNEDLPYGGKVMVARRKKPDPLWFIALQIVGAVLIVALIYYSYYHFDNALFNLHRVYGHFGHTEAQHQVGQRYLQGIGTPKDHNLAAKWFKKAAAKGHPEASYNLAVGHLKGHHKLRKGDARRHLKHAGKMGVKEANKVLRHVCKTLDCD